MNNSNFTLRSGRMMAYSEFGDLAGTLVICFHGMLGSRLLFQVVEEAVLENGVRTVKLPFFQMKDTPIR